METCKAEWVYKCDIYNAFTCLTGYKTLEVISGKADAYVHVTAIKKWDICAGNALIRELGGKQTTLLGNDVDYSSTGNPANTDGLLVTLSDHNTYLKALEPAFKEMQAEAASKVKRDVSAVNYKIAPRDTNQLDGGA